MIRFPDKESKMVQMAERKYYQEYLRQPKKWTDKVRTIREGAHRHNCT